VQAETLRARRRVVEAADALKTAIDAVRRHPHQVSREDLRAFPACYREAVTQLAEARSRGIPSEQLAELETLLVQAHGYLYAPESVSFASALGHLLISFPLVARRYGREAALATGLLVAGALWGFFEVHRDPIAAAILLPSSLEANAELFKQGMSVREGDPVYGALYFTNNARVAFAAYALGATFGIGTVAILLFNGVVLGATVAIVAARGSLQALLSYVLPHVGIELTAIVLAAAAGLHLGAALLSPGWKRRRDALTMAARETLPLVIGSATLLVLAGLMEGWIAPMALPFTQKAVIGGTLDIALLAYFVLPRDRRGTSLTQA
jgi:uncharacterized membrane protein SpoIIM required for sporulation